MNKLTNITSANHTITSIFYKAACLDGKTTYVEVDAPLVGDGYASIEEANAEVRATAESIALDLKNPEEFENGVLDIWEDEIDPSTGALTIVLNYRCVDDEENNDGHQSAFKAVIFAQ